MEHDGDSENAAPGEAHSFVFSMALGVPSSAISVWTLRLLAF
jgi:hypothetical protein